MPRRKKLGRWTRVLAVPAGLTVLGSIVATAMTANPAAADTGTGTLCWDGSVIFTGVCPADPLQTITWAEIADQTVGGPALDVSLYASASSGLAVSFTSQTPAVCTVSGTLVTAVAAGTCTIEADQPGDGITWAAAPPADQSFTVKAAPVSPLTALGQAVQGVGPGSSLSTKVATAQSSLASGDTAGACTALTGVINQVKAQSGKSIPAAQAAALIAGANAARATASC